MNPFKRHGLTHLSSSQLTTFSADPSAWFAQKVLGMKNTFGAAAERGKSVELGVVHVLTGRMTIEQAIDEALETYDREVIRGVAQGMSDAAIKEREAIPDMIRMAVDFLVPYGSPDFPDHGSQHRISLPARFGPGEDDVIDLIGYLDLVYPGHVIDLKTTGRMPGMMSWAHRIQHGIYARAVRPKPVSFLYVTPKKIELMEPTAEEIAISQEQVRQIVRRMANFLALGDKETLAAAVPINFDGWSWRGNEDERMKLLGV